LGLPSEGAGPAHPRSGSGDDPSDGLRVGTPALHAWFEAQFAEKNVEPNSGLGEAIKYILRHWDRLTPLSGSQALRWIRTSSSAP
jgi:hypothetical protein